MPVSNNESKKTSEEENNSLLDMSQSSVKKMIAQAKLRGYITYDELNEFMPPEQVSSEQIEDVIYKPLTKNRFDNFLIEFEKRKQMKQEAQNFGLGIYD